MAKRLLDGYKIGGDIIDQLSPVNGRPVADAVLTIPVPIPPVNSVETPVSAESPPAGESSNQASSREEPKNETHEEPKTETREEPQPEAEAEPTSKPAEPATLSTTKDGLFQVFSINGTTYRVGGIKPLFITSLRLNIRASAGDQTYYDTLDLYSAKARSGFASALNRAWGVEPSRIEKDLVRILEHLEHERDEQLRSTSARPVIEITPEDRALGMELLRDPHIFERIIADLSALGYVGEDLNKCLLYLCASSRKLDDPISVLILSQSASGKSFLVDSVKKLIPPEDVVAVTSLSDQALNYIDNLMHVFLILGEAVHGEVVEHQIREMLSGKELSRMVTLKDPETGKLQSRIVRTPVIVSSVLSGTNHAVNPENASRCFVVNTDESKEQTSRIHENQRRKYSLERIKATSDSIPQIIRTHHAAQRLLQKRTIINTFAPLLDFPTSLMRLRRDHDRFLDLIACVCFLRQFQKQIKHDEGLDYIECDLDDYAIAYRIMMEGVLASTMRELPLAAQMLYEELRKLAHEEALKQGLRITEVSFTQRHLRESGGFSHTWVKTHLRQLVDYDYVTVNRGGGERSKGFYRLKDDSGITTADLSMIPTPQVMDKLMEGGQP